MNQYLNITAYSFLYLFMAVLFFVYTIKNRLDILAVGMVCYVVYTMYCFFGYGIAGFYRPKLSATLYWLVFTQMAMLLVFTSRKRRKDGTKYLEQPGRCELTGEEAVKENKRVTLAFELYTAVIVFFALINMIPLGLSGFAQGKANVWENTNVLYIVSLYGAYPSFIYGLYAKKKRIWIPAFLIECGIFFAGSRAFLATMIVMFLCERGVAMWRKKQNNRSVFILGALAICFLLMYRTIDKSLLEGNLRDALRILSQPETWLKALEFNEPRVIIANYDYSITSGIRLPAGDVIYRIIDIVPGMTRLFPIKLQYPEYFSDWLTESVHGSTGVGGSFWGESYAMWGLVGVVLFTALWIAWLRRANNHLDHHRPYSSFVVALGTYHAWYINRLDFNRVGQSIKVMLLCFLIWACFYLVLGGELRIGKKIRIKLCKPLMGIIEILWGKTGKPVVDYVSRKWLQITSPARRISSRIKAFGKSKGMQNALAVGRRIRAATGAVLGKIWSWICAPGRKFCRWLSGKIRPCREAVSKKAQDKVIAPCRSVLRKAADVIVTPIGVLTFTIGTGLGYIGRPVGRFLGKIFRFICNKFVDLCAKIETKLIEKTCQEQ